MKGDTLILDCTLQDKLPKASIDWKFSNHPTKPLPVRTITSRNQLILKTVTENLDPISCYASVGIVSWEQKFEISFLSTSEIKKKHQDDKNSEFIPRNAEAYSCLHGDTSPVATISLARIQECNKESFSRFQLADTNGHFNILHQQHVSEIPIKRCFVRVEISRSHCTLSSPMAFNLSYKGSLKITPQQCETAHVRG